jgi:hypothetical protein
MIKKLLVLIVAGGIAAVVVREIPALQRELKIMRM